MFPIGYPHFAEDAFKDAASTNGGVRELLPFRDVQPSGSFQSNRRSFAALRTTALGEKNDLPQRNSSRLVTYSQLMRIAERNKCRSFDGADCAMRNRLRSG
jgi:hypothetical protein